MTPRRNTKNIESERCSDAFSLRRSVGALTWRLCGAAFGQVSASEIRDIILRWMEPMELSSIVVWETSEGKVPSSQQLLTALPAHPSRQSRAAKDQDLSQSEA